MYMCVVVLCSYFIRNKKLLKCILGSLSKMHAIGGMEFRVNHLYRSKDGLPICVETSSPRTIRVKHNIKGKPNSTGYRIPC